jgi:hypothetical protein
MNAEVAIRVTWSKVMAFLILGCAMILDLKNGGCTAFMFAVPAATTLIVGKQYFDRNKPEDK